MVIRYSSLERAPSVRTIPAFFFMLMLLCAVPALAQQHAPHGTPSSGPAAQASLPVHMKVRTVWPMKAGEKLDIHLYLWTDKGPLRLEDMDTVHTKKLHLFLLSPDFKDFYHVHPIATGGEGEFRFTVQPTRKVPLRVWAEFTIKGKRHVLVGDLDGKTDAITPPVAPQVVQAETGDIIFTIHFSGEVRAGHTVPGQIYAINKNSRLPYTELEPVLGSWAHIAAFASDYQGFYHTHPDGPEIKDPNALGGPTMKFMLTPEKPGMMKIFAQFKTRGYDLLAPFTVRVSPAVRPTRQRSIDDPEEPVRPPDAEFPGGP
jgi:hypothetical protein